MYLGSAGFFDDLYLFAASLQEAQCMLDEVVQRLQDIGVRSNPVKAARMANRFCNALSGYLLSLGHVLIPLSESIEVLGCIVAANGAAGPHFEQTTKRGWKCFNKWRNVLLGLASLQKRLEFLTRCILPSMTWGTQTTRT